MNNFNTSFSKRQVDISGVSPDYNPPMPKQKRQMHKSSEVASGPDVLMDLSFINRKIAEMEHLLDELYKLRDHFEQKNQNKPVPSYFA